VESPKAGRCPTSLPFVGLASNVALSPGPIGTQGLLPFATGSRGVGGLTPPISPVALFFLLSYRASFLLPFPRSMAMVVFFLAAILMVVALIGLLVWFFFLWDR
jgi:hypothetical protein